MMIKSAKNNVMGRKKHLGQGMTEYIIIVGVIAVAAIGTFGAFGDVMETQLSAMATELGGGDGSAAQGAAKTMGEEATTNAAIHNTLSNYHTDNN